MSQTTLTNLENSISLGSLFSPSEAVSTSSSISTSASSASSASTSISISTSISTSNLISLSESDVDHNLVTFTYPEGNLGIFTVKCSVILVNQLQITKNMIWLSLIAPLYKDERDAFIKYKLLTHYDRYKRFTSDKEGEKNFMKHIRDSRSKLNIDKLNHIEYGCEFDYTYCFQGVDMYVCGYYYDSNVKHKRDSTDHQKYESRGVHRTTKAINSLYRSNHEYLMAVSGSQRQYNLTRTIMSTTPSCLKRSADGSCEIQGNVAEKRRKKEPLLYKATMPCFPPLPRNNQVYAYLAYS